MEEIDRWALAELSRVTKEVLAAYEAYEFHNVYRAVFNFATVTLSARYFDIIKDRLYTFAPRNKARRSAQTALLEIADSLARMLGPILVFTADEIWENLPDRAEPSIHLALLPKAADESHEALLVGVGTPVCDSRRRVACVGRSAHREADRELAASESDVAGFGQRARVAFNSIRMICVICLSCRKWSFGVATKVRAFRLRCLQQQMARNANAAGTIRRASANRSAIRLFASAASLH